MDNEIGLQPTNNKNYFFVIIFLGLLIIGGAYFVYKIPSDPVQNSLSQSDINFDNINASESGETLGETAESSPKSLAKNEKMENKLKTEDLVVGSGAEAVSGKRITVNYTGTFTNGTPFDSNTIPSFGHVEPFAFTLGAGEVIQGWDQGFSGMKVGGKRKITVPPELGYGTRDYGTIPGNSTLVFEVELLKVE